MDTKFEVFDPNSATASRDRLTYQGDAESGATAEWGIDTDVGGHGSKVEPLDYEDRDFTLNSTLTITATDGSQWRAVSGPTNYSGSTPLALEPLPTLMIARRSIGGPKDRSVVFLAPPEGICPGHALLPFSFPGLIEEDTEILTEWPEGVPVEFGATVNSLPVNNPTQAGPWLHILFDVRTAVLFGEDRINEPPRWVSGWTEEPFIPGPDIQPGDVFKIRWSTGTIPPTVQWVVNETVIREQALTSTEACHHRIQCIVLEPISDNSWDVSDFYGRVIVEE